MPPSGHHSSNGIRLTGGGFAAKVATISFFGDVVTFFALIVHVDIVGRYSSMVVRLGVSVIMAFSRLLGQGVALENGPAEFVVRISFPGLVGRVVFRRGAYSVSCSEGGVLIVARKVVALGASDLSGNMLKGIVVEFWPSSNA